MILDTNAVSAILDGDTDIRSIASSAGPFWLPVIAIGDYRFGLLGSRKRRPMESRFRELVGKCSILDVHEQTAELYSVVCFELKQKGRPLPDNDIWIAALARQYHLPIVSRDFHFDDVDGIRRISW